MKVLFLSSADVAQLLTMGACIEAVEKALVDLAEGRGVQPLRSILWLPDRAGALGTMPGAVGEPATLGAKIVSVFPANHAKGLPSHQGVVLLFDPKTGSLRAVMDGERMTAIRTAAASAVATRVLAREGARRLAILGSGAQADTHLEAMRAVRDLESVRVWSRTERSASDFVERARPAHDIDLRVSATAQEAVAEADIICTVTAAREPVLLGEWLRPGMHVNAVGGCVPTTRELDTEAMRRARIYFDRRESVLTEAGDFIIPMKEGQLTEADLIGEVGDVLRGTVPGRESDDEITLFESLGIAAEDLGPAGFLYDRALEEGCGTWVEM